MRFLQTFVMIILLFSSGINYAQPATYSNSATPTKDILEDMYGAENHAYIERFMEIAEKSTVTLDPFFKGEELSEHEYSEADKQEIVNTLNLLLSQQFSKAKPQEFKTYNASAGAPGSGKTFAIEKMFGIDVANKSFPNHAIYVGPDSVVLSQMIAYNNDLLNKSIGPEAAYKKWRAASNYIANFMLVKAITDGLDIVHDSTSTNYRTKAILTTLANEGYKVNLHLFIADKATREKELKRKKQKLGYMVALNASPSLSKAEAAFERLTDGTYMENVSTLTVYAQPKDFFLGKGETLPIARFNSKEDANLIILPNQNVLVKNILQEVDESENLKPALRNAVHKFIETWINRDESEQIS